ncbi:hypothetical protein G7Y89_g1254 [Cudoniella acicularis]|uniref:Uncharacterized protein n=1 Tax=Cudoniella acicularis TaxID=354080 RepID=A0A8H4WAH1_9HELO|nr:hypothetical protein G7Y89_g1254 [Cudoniella acicularis]
MLQWRQQIIFSETLIEDVARHLARASKEASASQEHKQHINAREKTFLTLKRSSYDLNPRVATSEKKLGSWRFKTYLREVGRLPVLKCVISGKNLKRKRPTSDNTREDSEEQTSNKKGATTERSTATKPFTTTDNLPPSGSTNTLEEPKEEGVAFNLFPELPFDIREMV